MKQNRFLLLIKLCCLCWLLLSSQTIARAQTIKVVTEYFPPFQFINEQGQLDGYATAVVHRLFALTQDSADIKVMPWARAYQTALHEQNVMIYTMARNQIREPLFQWIGAIADEQIYFWGLKSAYPTALPADTNIKNKLIVTSKHSNPDQYMSQQGFSKLYRVTDINQGMAMLFSRRVELMVGTEIDMAKRAQKLGYDFNQMIKVYELPALNHQLCIAFNLQTDPAVVQRFRSAFQTLIENHQLELLQQQWHIPPPASLTKQ